MSRAHSRPFVYFQWTIYLHLLLQNRSVKQTSQHQIATPLQSVEAHMLASKRAELELLNATLECLETDNKSLLQSVLEKRASVSSAKEWVHQLTLDKLAADSIGQLETCL